MVVGCRGRLEAKGFSRHFLRKIFTYSLNLLNDERTEIVLYNELSAHIDF